MSDARNERDLWPTMIERLESVGFQFAQGLGQSEFTEIEAYFGFRFPPDLRTFLAAGVPVSQVNRAPSFPRWDDWRAHIDYILDRLQWPFEGMCFDIEHAEFWMPDWEPKPSSLVDAFAIAKRHVNAAPILIPIYGHRHMPDRPHERANPVFSVYQTDIIYYGVDLADYFDHEFLRPAPRRTLPRAPRQIELWSDIAECRHLGGL
jgi:hypothetical protein